MDLKRWRGPYSTGVAHTSTVFTPLRNQNKRAVCRFVSSSRCFTSLCLGNMSLGVFVCCAQGKADCSAYKVLMLPCIACSNGESIWHSHTSNLCVTLHRPTLSAKLLRHLQCRTSRDTEVSRKHCEIFLCRLKLVVHRACFEHPGCVHANLFNRSFWKCCSALCILLADFLCILLAAARRTANSSSSINRKVWTLSPDKISALKNVAQFC